MIENHSPVAIEKEQKPLMTFMPKRLVQDQRRLQSNKRLLLTALALGWSVDWLFYGKSVGVSLILFVVAVVSGLWWNGRYEKTPPIRQNMWLILPLLFFATMVFIRSNPFLVTLNVLAVLALLAYLAFFYGDGRVHNISLLGSLLIPLRVGGNSLIQTAPVVAETVDMGKLRTQGRKRLFPILRGFLFAFPILVLFTALLASADLIFADYVDNALSLEIIPNMLEWGWRSLLILAVAWLFAGGLLLALRQRTHIEEESLLERSINLIPRKIGFGFTETTTMLLLINFLFLSFVMVQFNYLFGGTINVDDVGYTYAEYARKGFFELLTVAVLTLIMILGLNWITQRQNKRQIGWFNGLSSTLVGFVLIMLVSAFRRMRLYEAEFGYTELRLQVYLFMAWLGGLLLWFVFTQWRRPDQFAIGFIVMMIGFLGTLNLINPDRFIVQQNMARYERTGDLDAAYLTSLSDDAMPALFAALPLVRGDEQELLSPKCNWVSDRVVGTRYAECSATATEILVDKLNGRYQTMSESTEWQKWQSFNLSRSWAFRQLETVFGE